MSAPSSQNALKSALDCDAFAVFAKTWAAAEQLSDYADPDKHPPGERSVIELGAHEISRALEPVIAVTIGSCPCIELKFTFTVTGNFGGVALSVMNGHIIGGRPGDAWATGQLSYNGIPLHEAGGIAQARLAGSVRVSRARNPDSAAPFLGAADGGTSCRHRRLSQREEALRNEIPQARRQRPRSFRNLPRLVADLRGRGRGRQGARLPRRGVQPGNQFHRHRQRLRARCGGDVPRRGAAGPRRAKIMSSRPRSISR